MKGECAMDKKYEDKLRELLDSGISAEEFV